MSKIDISTPKYPNTFAIVDDDIYEELSKYKWHKNSHGYCIRFKQKNKVMVALRMHREILNAQINQHIDHINGDKLDNRRCNLRICSNQQNSFNKKLNLKSLSGYKGVRWRKDTQIWQVRIMFNYKSLSFGHYKIKEQAAVAYNIAARQLYGNFAYLNQVPNETEIIAQIKNKVEKYLKIII